MSQELNLLPPERRQLLNMQMGFSAGQRVLKILLWGVGIVTISGLLTIAVLWIMIFSASQSDSINLDQAISEYRTQRELVIKKNAVLDNMNNLSRNRIVWSELLPGLFKVFPPGMDMKRLSGQRSAGARMIIEGQAVNRNALVVFEERLRALPWVRDVNAPNSNLINRVNPDYSFTLLLNDPSESPSPSPSK